MMSLLPLRLALEWRELVCVCVLLYVCLVEASGSNGASPVTPTGTGRGKETPAAHHLGMCQDAHTQRNLLHCRRLCFFGVQLFIYSYRHCIHFLLGLG